VEPFTILQDVHRPTQKRLYGMSVPNPHLMDSNADVRKALLASTGYTSKPLCEWYCRLQCSAIESKALLCSLSTLPRKAAREYVDRRDTWTAQPLRDWDSRGKQRKKRKGKTV